MILANDINTSLVAYYLDFINAWLLSKSKPNSLHPYVLSHISHAFLWILLCASNSSPGCPSGLPWQFFPVLPSFILLSPCLSWNLSPSQVQHSPCGFFFMVFSRCPQDQEQPETSIFVLPWWHFFTPTFLPILWSVCVSLDHLFPLLLATNWRSSSVLHYPWRIWTIFTIYSFIPVADISLGNVITMWQRAAFQVVLARSPNQPLFPTKSQGTC